MLFLGEGGILYMCWGHTENGKTTFVLNDNQTQMPLVEGSGSRDINCVSVIQSRKVDVS